MARSFHDSESNSDDDLGDDEGQQFEIEKSKKQIDKKITKKGRPSKEDKKRKRKIKRNNDSFAFYIYKVLKQMFPEIGISRKAMNIMNSFVNDTYDRITTEASKLVKWQNKRTISSREIQTSVKLNLPGDLAKHAISEANRAVAKFTNK